MIELDFLKDGIAVLFFIFVFAKLYYMNLDNMSSTKYELMIYIGIAFLTDVFYTIFSGAHNQTIGLNLHSFVSALIFLVFILCVIHFNM